MNILFRIMTQILVSRVSEGKLGTWLMNMYKSYKKVRDKIGKVKSIYSMYMNPNNWINTLRTVTKKQANELLKELAKMEKETHTEQYYKTNTAKRNEELGQMKQEYEGQGKWVTLSSSWLKAGKFMMMSKNKRLGTLYIQTKKSTKVYAYPMVTYDVWFLMKQANGSNGGGAGTVFWKYWLRKWLPSQLRKKVYADYQTHHITKEEAEQVFHAQTETTARYYGRSDEFKKSDALNDTIKSQGGKGFIPNRNKTYKEYLNQKYEEMHYKEVTTRWRKYGEMGDKAASFRHAKSKIKKGERQAEHVVHPFRYAKNKTSAKIRNWGKDL